MLWVLDSIAPFESRSMPVADRRGKAASPLVDGSAQRWKVTGGLGAMVVAAAASLFQLFGASDLKAQAIAVAVASGVLGIALLLLVRCPSCGRSLGAWAFRTGSLTTWHEALVEVVACPYCGHEAGRGGGARR
jgi:hypothetical protein